MKTIFQLRERFEEYICHSLTLTALSFWQDSHDIVIVSSCSPLSSNFIYNNVECTQERSKRFNWVADFLHLLVEDKLLRFWWENLPRQYIINQKKLLSVTKKSLTAIALCEHEWTNSDKDVLYACRNRNSKVINFSKYFNLRLSLLGVSISCLLFSRPSQGQDCDHNRNTAKYSRIFLVIYDGSADSWAERATVLDNLGECRSPEEHAEKMIEHFQTRYAINLTHIQQNPYVVYDDDDYFLTPNAAQPGKSDIIISGTMFGYTRFMNSPLYFSNWYLMAKKDIATPQGIVKAGNWLHYGMMR